MVKDTCGKCEKLNRTAYRAIKRLVCYDCANKPANVPNDGRKVAVERAESDEACVNFYRKRG